MLGTARNLMIRHMIYKALPHREGEGRVTLPPQIVIGAKRKPLRIIPELTM
jgi:hypothetical protein